MMTPEGELRLHVGFEQTTQAAERACSQIPSMVCNIYADTTRTALPGWTLTRLHSM